MLSLAVMLIALALLFLLTTLALGIGGQIRHPLRPALALVAALAVGAAILYEYGSA